MALSVADQVLIIASGRMVFQGTPSQLEASPAVLDEHLGISSAKPTSQGIPV
jgi:ABC-type branched-subunit amino acid transport system ATPase component